MMWIRPNESHLVEVVQQAKGSLLVCSPYISRWGLQRVEENLQPSLTEIEVWTKLDSSDWLAGASDPEALLDFAEAAAARLPNFRLRVSNSLHAKFVLADQSRALAGSANLTHGGFVGNIEVVRLIDDPEIHQFVEYVHAIRHELTLSRLSDLRTFVTTCNDQAKDKEALLDLIREVAPPPVSIGRPLIPLSEFMSYVQDTRGALAAEIEKIYFNRDNNNRTGHLKQGFYGAQRFLQEYPQAIQRVVDMTSIDNPFELQTTTLIEDWRKFIHDFAEETDPRYQYDFTVLRNYLTLQFGGPRTGGGGGDYPFKLVWPHLARQMQSP